MSGLSPSQGRNLWPAGIIATFVVFIAGTVGLIVLSARNDVQLVRPDYYEQELRYQERMNQRERTQALPQAARVTYDAVQRRLILALPAAHVAATGEIQLYRPSAAGMDRRLSLRLDAQGQQTLDAAALGEGLWRVRVMWRVGDEEFACDEKVVIGDATPAPSSRTLPPSQFLNAKPEAQSKPEARNSKPANAGLFESSDPLVAADVRRLHSSRVSAPFAERESLLTSAAT